MLLLNSRQFLAAQGREIDLSEIAPGNTKAKPRLPLPNCTVCWGCKHTLELMASGSVSISIKFSEVLQGGGGWGLIKNTLGAASISKADGQRLTGWGFGQENDEGVSSTVGKFDLTYSWRLS